MLAGITRHDCEVYEAQYRKGGMRTARLLIAIGRGHVEYISHQQLQRTLASMPLSDFNLCHGFADVREYK